MKVTTSVGMEDGAREIKRANTQDRTAHRGPRMMDLLAAVCG